MIPAPATRTAEPTRVTVDEAVAATPASRTPKTISPRFSAWDNNECTVARTPLVVRRLTRTVDATRIVGDPTPRTISAAAIAHSMVGAWANTTSPTAAITDAAT